ncbi:class I adenylate-forming enzyme family protein [Novipirellula artificiosorum]|nr:AMP-binding protein [Novipirellula artificiosorum]
MVSNLLDAFDHQVRTQPSSVALIGDVATTYTWLQLARQVQATAESLHAKFAAAPAMPRHLGYGSRNSLADVVLTLAAARIGVINVPLNELGGENHLQDCWQQVGGYWIDDVEALLASSTRLGQMEFDRVDPNSAGLILWTSGTSGSPKGVVLSHRSLASNAQAKLSTVPQTSQDVRLTCLPVSHAYARTCDLGTWLLSGCTLALTRGFEGWTRLAAFVQPTLANVVPSVAERLLAGDADELGMQRLRVLGVGGAGLSASSFQQWKTRGIVVTQGYGCTETAPVICSATPENAVPGCVGMPVEGWETEIRDGRLFVRGPHLMLGYWQNPIATRERIDADGWFDTGDLVELDSATGQYRILGRQDDVIVLPNGHKVFPATIERIVDSLGGVRHSMLRYGEGQLQLWVETDLAGTTWEHLCNTAVETLTRRPRWERPRVIERFAEPLRRIEGELTEKGTICRSRIEQLRFQR